MAYSTRKPIIGEIFSAGQAKGMPALSQHWGKQELQTYSARKNILIYQFSDLVGIHLTWS
jgi:hypothetical protein